MTDKIIHIKRSHVVGIVIAAVVFMITCFYGFLMLKEDQKKDNCWDNYTTEQEAILNCEGVNE